MKLEKRVNICTLFTIFVSCGHYCFLSSMHSRVRPLKPKLTDIQRTIRVQDWRRHYLEKLSPAECQFIASCIFLKYRGQTEIVDGVQLQCELIKKDRNPRTMVRAGRIAKALQEISVDMEQECYKAAWMRSFHRYVFGDIQKMSLPAFLK